MHFTDAEVGLYTRLLCVQWSVGSLPDNDDELQSYGKGGTPLHRVKAKFTKGSDGRLRNIRMEIERKKQIEYRKSCSTRGKSGASARWLKHKSSNAQGMPKNSSPSPSPSPSPISDLLSPSPVRTSASRFVRPSIEEVKLHAQKIGLPETEVFKFHAYYESNGWKVGRNPMKSWPGAMANWKISFEEGRYAKSNQSNSGIRNQPTKPISGSAPNNGF